MEREGYFERAECVEEVEVILWSGAILWRGTFRFLFLRGSVPLAGFEWHLIDSWLLFSDLLSPFFWSCPLGLFIVILAPAFCFCLVSFFILTSHLPSFSASFSTHHPIFTPLYCYSPFRVPGSVLSRSSRLCNNHLIHRYATAYTLIRSIFFLPSRCFPFGSYSCFLHLVSKP